MQTSINDVKVKKDYTKIIGLAVLALFIFIAVNIGVTAEASEDVSKYVNLVSQDEKVLELATDSYKKAMLAKCEAEKGLAASKLIAYSHDAIALTKEDIGRLVYKKDEMDCSDF